jgi:hypothetical protein
MLQVQFVLLLVGKKENAPVGNLLHMQSSKNHHTSASLLKQELHQLETASSFSC